MRDPAPGGLFLGLVVDLCRANLAMGHKCSISVTALLAACLLGNVTGCGSTSIAPTGDTRAARGALKVVGVEYARFVAQHDGRPPADKQSLATFFETRKGSIAGLDDVQQLFVSPRDNEPFIIYYGESMPPADDSGFPSIAREMTGAAGKCLVANTRGGVTEMALDELPPHLATPN